MKASAAIAGGIAGTIAVASLHEALRRVSPDAPRMDKLDMDLIRKGLDCIKQESPDEEELQRWAVAGELFADTAFFSIVGMGCKNRVWMRGILLGLFAGITAIILPKPLGLPTEPSNKNRNTQLMTLGLYLTGGTVAAAVTKLVDEAQETNE